MTIDIELLRRWLTARRGKPTHVVRREVLIEEVRHAQGALDELDALERVLNDPRGETSGLRDAEVRGSLEGSRSKDTG